MVSSKDDLQARDVGASGPLGDVSRVVLHTAHEAYVCMDAGGFITDMNGVGEGMFGWSRSEAVGRLLGDTIIPERYRQAHLRGLSRFVEGGERQMVGKRLVLRVIS